jgi:hypothetical protein
LSRGHVEVREEAEKLCIADGRLVDKGHEVKETQRWQKANVDFSQELAQPLLVEAFLESEILIVFGRICCHFEQILLLFRMRAGGGRVDLSSGSDVDLARLGSFLWIHDGDDCSARKASNFEDGPPESNLGIVPLFSPTFRGCGAPRSRRGGVLR